MALGRCLLPKESSQIDETIENWVIWRMAIFMLLEPRKTKSTMTVMRRMTRFSMVSSIQDDSFGSKHLPSAI
jgi:hypothetical protein